VKAENRPTGGALFTVRLPLAKPPPMSPEATPVDTRQATTVHAQTEVTQ